MFVTGTVATAAVSGTTVNSFDVTVIVSSGTIQKGLVVEGTGIPVGTTVASVSTTETFSLNTQVSLSDATVLTFKLPKDITVTTVTSQSNITVSTLLTLADNTPLRFVEPSGILRLETGTATATDLGHSLISEFLPDPVSDTYTTGADQMVLEDATVDLGEVKRIQLTNKGVGFTKLPTITIAPARGTKILDTQGN